MFEFARFDPEHTKAFVGYHERTAKRFWLLVERVLDRFEIEVGGLDNVPGGGALLVMNHAFGWDAMLPMAAIRRATGRRVWALGEHLWWKLPFVRNLAASVGTVDGNPENVDALLGAGELVLVLPGGLREAVKPAELRYRLLWGKRYGFVRAAVRNRAALVPLAAIGSDEWIDLAGNPFVRGKKWFGIDFPIPRPRYGLPLVHRLRPKYLIGEPITAAVGPGEDEEHAMRRLRREVRGAIEEMLDEELAARHGFAG